LEQVMLRPWDAVDELIPHKLRFLCVVLFAPIQPWGLVANIAASLLQVHLLMPKLLMLRRRGFPFELDVAHATQNIFTGLILPISIFWHLGLILVTKNRELHMSESIQSQVLSAWIVTSSLISMLAMACCLLLKRWLQKVVLGSDRGDRWHRELRNAYRLHVTE